MKKSNILTLAVCAALGFAAISPAMAEDAASPAATNTTKQAIAGKKAEIKAMKQEAVQQHKAERQAKIEQHKEAKIEKLEKYQSNQEAKIEKRQEHLTTRKETLEKNVAARKAKIEAAGQTSGQ